MLLFVCKLQPYILICTVILQQTTGDPRVRLVLQQQNPSGMMQPQMQLSQQQSGLQPNMPQQQQMVVAGGQNTNQTSPLLAQQLAGRPTIPGQHPSAMAPGQIMQQRQTLVQTQQIPIRSQNPPNQQNPAQGGSASSGAASSDGPSVSSDDLEGLDSHVGNELGDLGMGDGDFLDMGDDFDILEFTDTLNDLDDMPSEENKNSKDSSAASVPRAVGATPAVSMVSSSASILSSTSTVSSGATTSASVITTQPPPYTATGSVTVPLRGGLPQSTISGGIPGAPTNIIRGPPPPYPGPGLAPNTGSGTIGGNATNQTSKVRYDHLI